jgi:hypothetical protein
LPTSLAQRPPALDGADNAYSAAFSAAAGGGIALTRRDGAGTLLWTRSFDQTQADRCEAANATATAAATARTERQPGGRVDPGFQRSGAGG